MVKEKENKIMKKFNLMQVVPSLQSGGVEQGTIDVANYLAEIEKKKDLTDIEMEFMKKDIQLQKAIELLKTWKVFKELRPL